jgi:hypothetical protein
LGIPIIYTSSRSLAKNLHVNKPWSKSAGI